jgi:hypothetical protein
MQQNFLRERRPGKIAIENGNVVLFAMKCNLPAICDIPATSASAQSYRRPGTSLTIFFVLNVERDRLPVGVSVDSE